MRRKLYHSKAWLQTQRAKGKTAAEIARDCGVSQQIISVYLRKHGLQ